MTIDKAPSFARFSLPRPLLAWWGLAFLLSAPLFLRILYEQTVLTWSSGTQPVAFVFAQRFTSILVAGLVGHLAMAIWLFVVLVLSVRRKSIPRTAHMPLVLIALLGLVVVFTPYSFWRSVVQP